MDWIINNKEWFFSGLGVSVLGYLFSLFMKTKESSSKNEIVLNPLILKY